MINFRDVNEPNSVLGPERWMGKLLRSPLRLIPRSAVLPILQGPGRGLRWIVGSYNHGCWLGSYEYEKQLALKRLVRPGDVVYDVGAHVGFFTIILSRLVGAAGQVYAFEPVPENYAYLLRHTVLNRITNVVAVKAAIGFATGMRHFGRGPHSATGRLSGHEGFECEVYNLVEYMLAHNLRPPSLIKIDVEGAEAEVVPSILDYVVARRIPLLVSTHSTEITRSLADLLSVRGYVITSLQWARQPGVRTLDTATLILATA